MAQGSVRAEPEANVIKQLQQRLDTLNQAETTEESKAEYLEVSKKLDEHLLKQEICWAQRSRVSWLKHGEKIPIFFIQKHHKGGGKITLRVLKMHKTNGWRNSRKWSRQLLTTLIIYLVQVLVTR